MVAYTVTQAGTRNLKTVTLAALRRRDTADALLRAAASRRTGSAPLADPCLQGRPGPSATTLPALSLSLSFKLVGGSSQHGRAPGPGPGSPRARAGRRRDQLERT